MQDRAASTFPRAALLLGAGLALAAVGGWQAGCDRPEHGRIEVAQGDCQVCHAAEYQATTAPPHPGLFDMGCAQCHVNTGWVPAVAVDHPWFPLANAHAGPPCASCHTVGYAPGQTPTECVGCHLADYQASPYPGHETFSTRCSNCHGTVAWTPATAHPENLFPIANGPHSVVSCTSCHDASLGSPIDGMNANCVGCHTGHHTRAVMDSKHDEVSGYPSGDAPPNFCLECHVDGTN